MYYLSYYYCHNGINCKTCNLLNQCKKGKEIFIMGLWDKVYGGLADKNCDNCENYQKKEVKETFEDSFTVYGKKKDETNNFEGIKIIWYDVVDNSYEVCFMTKAKQRITIKYERDYWKKLVVNQVR